MNSYQKKVKKIIFRADASAEIGYGHFVRSLALANFLKDSYDCYFATVNPTEYQLKQISETCAYLPLPRDNTHFEYFLSLLKGDEIIVLDNYFFDLKYQTQIRTKGCKLVCIDDRVNISYDCDVLINHVLGVKASDVHVPVYCKTFLGPAYALLRPSFIECMREPCDKLPSEKVVLIAMGGTDFYNISYKCVQMVLRYTDYKINLLVGDAYKYLDMFSDFPADRLFINKNLEESAFISLIKESSIAICPSSSLSYEICAVGRPLLVGYFTPEQKMVAKQLERCNLAINCGDYNKIDLAALFHKFCLTMENSLEIVREQKEIFNGNQIYNLKKMFESLSYGDIN